MWRGTFWVYNILAHSNTMDSKDWLMIKMKGHWLTVFQAVVPPPKGVESMAPGQGGEQICFSRTCLCAGRPVHLQGSLHGSNCLRRVGDGEETQQHVAGCVGVSLGGVVAAGALEYQLGAQRLM